MALREGVSWAEAWGWEMDEEVCDGCGVDIGHGEDHGRRCPVERAGYEAAAHRRLVATLDRMTAAAAENMLVL